MSAQSDPTQSSSPLLEPSGRRRTVLVIGASGFVGRHVVRTLLADGHKVRCLARRPSRIQDLAAAGCEVAQGDLLDAASVDRALVGVQAVYICTHTLSPQGASEPGQDFMDVELSGLRNVVGGCKANGVRRVLYVTFIGVAQHGQSAWSRGRWKAEQYLFASGLDVTVFRPGMIVGQGGTGFEAVLSGARRPFAVGMGSGAQLMRTVAVGDLAYYLVGVLDEPRSFGHHYDVGSDDVLTVDQMTDLAAQALGRRPPLKIHIPLALLKRLAPLIERAGKMPRGSFSGLVDGLRTDMDGDPAPIRRLLGRPPESYSQSLKRALGIGATS